MPPRPPRSTWTPSLSGETEPGEAALDDRGDGDLSVPGDEERYGPEREELGRGALGRVVAVEERALRREVARKEMLDPDAPVAVARFLREARLTAALEHPGVVPVHALGVDPQGHPYYTMRRVRGRTLRDAMTACTTPAERRQLLGHFVALCQTLAYAHARGVVHRDVKPENVMVGPFGETLLLDWGLAGPARVAAEAPLGAPPLVDARQTRVGAVMGTPAYMSPEQARGEASQVGPATDVWSLGVLMVELLIGASPIDLSGTTEQIVARVARGELRDPAALAEVAPELRAITSKALAVDPAARYPDAGALAADVLAWQQGALVGAYDYTWSDRLYRWVRRNGAPLSVLGVAGVLGIVAGAFAFQQVRQERDVATAA